MRILVQVCRKGIDMKIMVQNRTMIVEQPRCVWVEPRAEPEGCVIASNVRRAPVLGSYSSVERAMEVLNEIFDFQRQGRINYCMPLK